MFPPQRPEEYDYHVFKAIITADPIENPTDCIVVVIFSDLCNLSFIRLSKDATWIKVDFQTILQFETFVDVFYYEDRFYAIHVSRILISFDVIDSVIMDVKLIADNSPPIKDEDGYYEYEDEDANDEEEEENTDHDNNDNDNTDADDEEDDDSDNNNDSDDDGYYYADGNTKKYLVKTQEGELWLTVRCFRRNPINHEFKRITTKIKTYKLDYKESSWVEIESLGDVALFLGDNSSIWVVASSFLGCRPNYIYFTHDYDTFNYFSDGPSDLGIYHVESGEIEWHYTIDATSIAKMSERPPIWVVPTI